MPRWLIFVLVVLLLAGAAGYAIWVQVMAPFAKRDADARIAFEPLEDLRPVFLHNGFGVYDVQFYPQSKLTDDNVAELLSLNKLPAKYDLSLWLLTPAITDASVPVLAQLTTTDTIVIERAGLTKEGITRLAKANPNLLLVNAKGKRLVEPVEN